MHMKNSILNFLQSERKILLFLSVITIILGVSAAQRIDRYPVYPLIWYRPDSVIVNPMMIDTIMTPDDYTMMIVYNSSKPNIKQPLWTMVSDSISYTVSSEENITNHVIYTMFHTIARDTVGFSFDSSFLYCGANQNIKSYIQLYETAYFPFRLTRPQALMFQTYLALKHGITLNHSNYLSTKGDVIWNAHTNRDYYNHIQGIGYDPFYHFYSIQSVSKEDSVLTIFSTDSLLPYSFALLGDNNAPMDLIPYEKNLSILQRRWMMRSTGELPELTMSVFTHEFMDNTDTLLLVMLSEDNEIVSCVYPSSIDTAGIAIYKIPSHDFYFSFVSRSEYVPSRTPVRKSAALHECPKDVLKSSFELYPILTSGEFTLEITLDREAQLDITIFDGTGKLVQSHELPSLSSYHYNGLISNPGIYIISVSDKHNNVLYTHQLIVY